MAFTTTETFSSAFGDKRVKFGIYTNSGTTLITGGTISTGLSRTEFIILQPNGTTVTDNAQPVVSTTIPADSGNVAIVTPSGQDGIYFVGGIE